MEYTFKRNNFNYSKYTIRLDTMVKSQAPKNIGFIGNC